MRILHTLKHCTEGNGHVHVAVDLACEQARMGHQVVFASGGGSYEQLLRDHGVDVHRIRGRSERQAPGALLDLLRLVRRTRPDVIHAHMMSSAVLAFAVGRLTDTPLVTTVHNSFDGHSGLMRVGTRIVAVSEAERSLLLGRGYPESRTVTVLNGSGGSAREGLRGRDVGDLPTPTLVTLSGLHARKGIDLVISAFARLTGAFPEWHLSIIGEGPDRPKLEQLVARLGLEERVRLLGDTTSPLPALRQASIFVSGSRAEPFGLAIAEARAAGCAVVAFAVGGVPEVLDDGHAGKLVPAGDVGAMVEALRGLMGDESGLLEWRRRASEGSERFSVARMTGDYQHVYASAVAARARTGSSSRIGTP